jgi:hypothetical protein
MHTTLFSTTVLIVRTFLIQLRNVASSNPGLVTEKHLPNISSSRQDARREAALNGGAAPRAPIKGPFSTCDSALPTTLHNSLLAHLLLPRCSHSVFPQIAAECAAESFSRRSYVHANEQ